jgi:hypothetical protein
MVVNQELEAFNNGILDVAAWSLYNRPFDELDADKQAELREDVDENGPVLGCRL